MATALNLFGICIVCKKQGCNYHKEFIMCDDCRHIRCPLVTPARITVEHILCEYCDAGGQWYADID